MSRLPTLDGDNEGNDKSKSMGLPSMDDMPSLEDSPSVDGMPSIDDMPPIGDSDDEFESIPADDSLDNDAEEHEDNVYLEAGDVDKQVNRGKKVNKSPEVSEDYEDSEDSYDGRENYADDDYNPDYEDDLEELKKDKFIDKKKRRLIPFGGKKSKRKKFFVKSSDFDDRKNKLAKTKIIQFSIIVLMLLMFLLGLKNTLIPSHVYTGDQIRKFAAEGAGQTGFPEERGNAYVESFMQSYLTIDRTRPEFIQVLSHFYGEDNNIRSDSERTNMIWGDTKQHVIIPPRVFEVDLLTEYSAQYKVSTYVSNTDGEEVAGEKAVGRWLSFSVNVYYDIDSDSMVITPDSPSIIPAYRIVDQKIVPDRAPFGNGTIDRDIVPALTPTINGFIEAYAKSSVESHESVLQYIDNKDDIDLYDGFGGAVELNGNPADAINKVIYESNDGIYRADLTVKWIDTAASQGDSQVEYTARYIMRIKPSTDGKYTVSSFVPYTYYK